MRLSAIGGKARIDIQLISLARSKLDKRRTGREEQLDASQKEAEDLLLTTR